MPAAPFREILILVAGSTPQIITETIQALAMQIPPIYIDELFIITTATGRRLIEQKLLREGILAQMCKEWDIKPVKLDKNSFHVFTDSQGKPLEDIRSAEENELVGDQLADFLCNHASEPGTRLHCSLAGGRKTMSFYMGTAFQLFARQWDKLYHVIVSSDFEKNPSFFYKPKVNRTLTAHFHDGSNKQINTDDAEITLTELPLIYLRNKLTLSGGKIRDMVAEGQKTIDSAAMQLPVRVDLAERTIYIGETLIELPPAQLALYTGFLRLKNDPCKFSNRNYCQECTACFVPVVEMSSEPFLESMADDYQAIYCGDITKREEQLGKWQKSLDASNMRQQISKVNKVLKEEIRDEALHPFYLISCLKRYGGSRYGVRVEKGKVWIEG